MASSQTGQTTCLEKTVSPVIHANFYWFGDFMLISDDDGEDVHDDNGIVMMPLPTHTQTNTKNPPGTFRGMGQAL